MRACEILLSVLLINSTENKDELSDQRKDTIIVKSSSSCCGISTLSASYNILDNIFPSRLSSFQISCIRRITETNWKYNETVHHQLLIDNGHKLVLQ
jgi:hypothetical protein